MPTFKHNDIVRVTRGRYAGRLGSIHAPTGLLLNHCYLMIDGVGFMSGSLPRFEFGEVEQTGFALGDFVTLKPGVFPQCVGVVVGTHATMVLVVGTDTPGGFSQAPVLVNHLIKLNLSIDSTDADGLATYALTPVKEGE